MKYVPMVYSRTAYAEYPLPQIEAGQWELLLEQTRFDLPEEASEIYFLSFPFGGQLVMAAKGVEEEHSPAFRTYRLDRKARNDARRTALETIRQILNFSYSIQQKKVF